MQSNSGAWLGHILHRQYTVILEWARELDSLRLQHSSSRDDYNPTKLKIIITTVHCEHLSTHLVTGDGREDALIRPGYELSVMIPKHLNLALHSSASSGVARGWAGWGKSSFPTPSAGMSRQKNKYNFSRYSENWDICTWVKLLTNLQILGCELHKKEAGLRPEPLRPSHYKGCLLYTSPSPRD